ncbi:MAG: hypothetical protein KDD10_30110 [Phaeodactylibacter sp.]|nr:hypothetical protein [Phaeodactylibacter sp.]MCB9297513.1 hypothetical protein [Lewinellaceae bacterium]
MKSSQLKLDDFRKISITRRQSLAIKGGNGGGNEPPPPPEEFIGSTDIMDG